MEKETDLSKGSNPQKLKLSSTENKQKKCRETKCCFCYRACYLQSRIDLGNEAEFQCCSQRWILAYMGLWQGMMHFLISSGMSVAIVCMVKDSKQVIEENSTRYDANVTLNSAAYNDSVSMWNIHRDEDDVCGTKITKRNVLSEGAEFSWNKTTQSVVLSAFFYGYMVMQVPGGWLAARFGGRRVIGTSMILSSVIMLLIPVFARTSVYLVVAARALLGLCIGPCTPSFNGMIGRWALVTERNRFLSLYWLGMFTGTILGYSTSGILCMHGFDNGWASIFYVHGILCVLFVGCWWFLVYTCPEEHPRISAAEKRLLLKQQRVRSKQSDSVRVPWKSLFTYLPIYAIFTAHMADGWSFYLLLTSLPLYFKDVHRFDIQSNGLLSSLPSVTYIIGIMCSGVCVDFFRSRDILSITRTRKLFQVTGLIGISAFILIPGYLDCEQRQLVIFCLCLATFFEAVGATAGFGCNVVDVAPRYASLIFGMSNTLCSISGIIAPLVVAALTKHQTVEEWRLVFYIAVGVSLFAALFYGLFADSEKAPWADNSSQELELEVPKETLPDDQIEFPLLDNNSIDLTKSRLS